MLSTIAICLALNVFHESRGEPVLGQIAVAHVTLNRARDESNNLSTVCDTVFQKNQFIWTEKYKNPKKSFMRIAKEAKSIDEASWDSSLKVATSVISGHSSDVTKGATYFNNKQRGRKYETDVKAKVIGKHIFY